MIQKSYLSNVKHITNEDQLAEIDNNNEHSGNNSVVAAGPDFAQEVLDRVGDDSIVILLEGSYDELFLRNSRWQSKLKVAGDFDDKYLDENGFLDMELYLSQFSNYYPYYYRDIHNIEIIGTDGVILEGGITSTTNNAEKDIIGGRDGNGYFLYYDIDGLALKNLIFDESTLWFEYQHSNSAIRNVNLENCLFKGSEATKTANNPEGYAVYMHKNQTIFTNINFTECYFDRYFQPIRLETIVDAERRNCTFTNTGHDAIELRGETDENIGGTYLIDSCYFDEIGGKAIGRAGFQNAEFIISNNDFSRIAEDADEGGKSIVVQFGDIGTTSEKQENISVTFTENSYNGRRLSDVNERNYSADRFIILAE